MAMHPRTKLGFAFTGAVIVSLSVLVPATLSYGMPQTKETITNLDFAAGLNLDQDSALTFVSTLDKDSLWTEVSDTDPQDVSVLQHKKYTSKDDWCTASYWDVQISEGLVEDGDDRATTQRWIDYVFPSSATNDTTDENWAAYKKQTSGRTVDTLTVSNGVSFTTFRASAETNTGVMINVTCQSDDELAAALQESVRLHTAIATD